MSNIALLDTHVFFWLVSKNPQISQDILEVLQDFDGLALSSISLWELAMLENKKRIILLKNVNNWLSEALTLSKVQLINISSEIAVDSSNLPGSFHKDPCDQLIVATARTLNMTLFTRDKKIIEYGERGFVKVGEL